MKSLLITMLFCFWVADEISAQDSLFLTVDEVIKIGLKNNVDVNTSALQIESSNYNVKEAVNNRLPKLTLNSSYNRNIDRQVIFLPEGFGGGGPTRIGLNNNFATSLDVSVPIYSKSYKTNKEYASDNNDLIKETYRGTRQSVITNIRKLYNQQLAALAAVKVRRKALNNAVENRDNVLNKMANGLATEFDSASANVKVKVAQNNLLDAERQAMIAANNLKIMSGIDIEIQVYPADSLALSADEELFNGQLGSLVLNSTRRQTEMQEILARQQVAVTKAAYLPTLSAVGSYQYQSQQNDFNFGAYRWVKTSYVGLKFQMPIFNGMVTRNKVQQAALSQKIARLQTQYISGYLEAQMKQVLTELEYAREKMILQKQNVTTSETALALTKERYNVGKGTFIEVSNAEFDLVSARLNYLQAILEFKTAFYDYLLLNGNDN